MSENIINWEHFIFRTNRDGRHGPKEWSDNDLKELDKTRLYRKTCGFDSFSVTFYFPFVIDKNLNKSLMEIQKLLRIGLVI